MSKSPGIDRLKSVLPANQNAMTKASKQGDIPNISTEPCAETPVFNSHQLEGAFRDQAGMSAEHLNLAASFVQQGQQELRSLRSDLSESTAQLQKLKLPDTKVNIEGIKMEVPFELKQYAVDIDQEKYMLIMFSLLGDDRMLEFQKHATKSNQNNTPALWLNQAVYIETCKPYVYNLSKNLEKLIPNEDERQWTNVSAEYDKLAGDYLDMALGITLRSKLNHIAQTNSLPLFVVFVLIVDEILKSRAAVSIPVTSAGLWANPFAKKEPAQ